MLAALTAAVEYFVASLGSIMSYAFQGITTAPTELAYSEIVSQCSNHSHKSNQQAWCTPDSMQSGPKEPSPVGSGSVHRSFLTPVVERITLCCALIALFLRWFWRWGSREKPQTSLPQLHFRPSSLLKYVLKTCHTLREPFVPTSWVWSGYLQTFMGLLLCDSTVRYRREVLQMTDGGIVGLDWARKVDLVDKSKRRRTHSKGIIIVLPDLVVGSAAVSRLCSSLCSSGYEAVVFHRRGTSGLPLTTPKCQSLGDPSDLRDVVQYLKSKLQSGKRMCAVAFGFGGSLLLSYLGNYGSSSKLSAAVCVSPVYDLQSTIQSKQSNSILNWFILQLLKFGFTSHVNTMPRFFDLDSAYSCRTLGQWLEQIDCPMYKIKDLSEYLEHNEPLREADEIATPLLCINSFNDPITRKENIPFDLFLTLPNLLLVTTENGGRCGFLEDLRNPTSWSNVVVLDFLDAVLQFTENVTNERRISGRMRIDS